MHWRICFGKRNRTLGPGLMSRVSLRIPGQCCSWHKGHDTDREQLGPQSVVYPMPLGSTEKSVQAGEQSRIFDLSAHRGGRGLYPENTLPAFKNALRIGGTSLEMDAAVTKDGIVVISHNPFLDPIITRGPDGKWIGKERNHSRSASSSAMTWDVYGSEPTTLDNSRFNS